MTGAKPGRPHLLLEGCQALPRFVMFLRPLCTRVLDLPVESAELGIEALE